MEIIEPNTPQTPPAYATPEPRKRSKGASYTFKGLAVAALILLLLIPVVFIQSLVGERQDRKKEVVEEVSSKWATDQTVAGPMVIIPYKGKAILNDKGVVTGYEVNKITLLPEVLDIQGEVTPFTRHRSIFDVTVYQSKLAISGNFAPLDVPVTDIYFNDVKVFFGLSDFRGIEEEVKIVWDGAPIEMKADDAWQIASTTNYDYDYDKYSSSRSSNREVRPGTHGLSAPLAATAQSLAEPHTFTIELSLKGSQELNFIPMGKVSSTRLRSSWSNPSFVGAFLPDNPAEITSEGFDASWKVLYINRQFPQTWINTDYDLKEAMYGVKLLEAADSYAQTQRSTKYAILFIALTLALYFFVEIFQSKKVHPLQYVMVGFALCLFYTLLLSMSEYMAFGGAYLIASAATILLISLYTKSAFGSWKTAGLFFGVLTLLYTFIYVLVQLQDRALLYGSIGLFVILAALMYSSRKIDWYNN